MLTSFTLLQPGRNVNTINFMTVKTVVHKKIAPYHHGNLREALFQAAIDVMVEKGGSAFSLSELARNLGVTPAAAYKHFVDKEALLAELTAYGFSRLLGRFEQAAPKAKPATNAKQSLQRFERIGKAYFEFGVEEPALFHLIFGKSAAGARRAVTANGERTPTFSYLAEALECLHRFDVIAQAPGPQAQWFAWSAIHGATELAIAGASNLLKTEHAARAVTVAVVKALQD